MISREVYETRERLRQGHSRDFLTVGSMGHASMIALGLAKAQPKRKVYCLDGDGASIMQMGNMAIVGQSGCGNLTHIVFNNAAHDSVGGQPTVGDDIDLPRIAESCGYNMLQPLVSQFDVKELNKELMADAVRFSLSLVNKGETSGFSTRPNFMEIKVSKGARKDLGRPKEPPQANKALYMKTLGVE